MMEEVSSPINLFPPLKSAASSASLILCVWQKHLGEGGPMGRHSCCYNQKLKKGLWSPEEDEKLLNYITQYGHGCWSSVPKLAGNYSSITRIHSTSSLSCSYIINEWWLCWLAGLQRCGKSCRLRWINYLRPDLKRGAFSQQEENHIIELHSILGNRSVG